MAEANWYVVHTYSGYENKVKVDIEKTIENRKLQDEILEVRVPLEDVVEMRNGVKKQVSRKMFPGYVLIHPAYSFSDTASHHSLEQSTPGTSIARWENHSSGAAPCQCFTSTGMLIQSPGFISTASLPSS